MPALQYIILSHIERPIQATDIIALYQEAEWWPERKKEDVQKILGSGPAIGAWKGNKLIGFARAVTDGKFRAYIEDVVIAKEHRKQGIGKLVIENLLGELKDIDVISLFSSEALAPLYTSVGFSVTRQRVFHKKKGA